MQKGFSVLKKLCLWFRYSFFYFVLIFSQPAISETFICEPTISVDWLKNRYKDRFSDLEASSIVINLNNEMVETVTWSTFHITHGQITHKKKNHISCDVPYEGKTKRFLECWSDSNIKNYNKASMPNDMAYQIMKIKLPFNINNNNYSDVTEIIRRLRAKRPNEYSANLDESLIDFQFSFFHYKHEDNDRSFRSGNNFFYNMSCE